MADLGTRPALSRSQSYSIQMHKVTMAYPDTGRGAFTALKDTSLSVYRGEFLALVGPSGCGKSTILRLLAGLASASSGSIIREGSEGTSTHGDLSIVFQNPRLLPWRTVAENVILPLQVGPGRKRKRVERSADASDSLLRLVGLEEFSNRYPHELSGGMQQRVAIARALITDAPVLLMDEPFGALDAFTRESLNEELLRIWADTQKTIVFVTHDIDEAVFLADRVAVMRTRPGQICEIISIGLSRPRTPVLRADTSFFDHVGRVRAALQICDASYGTEAEAGSGNANSA